MITGSKTNHLAKIILRNPMTILDARIKSGFDSKVFHSALSAIRKNKKYELVEKGKVIELIRILKIKPIRHHIVIKKGKE